jgi:hypothetical protein
VVSLNFVSPALDQQYSLSTDTYAIIKLFVIKPKTDQVLIIALHEENQRL